MSPDEADAPPPAIPDEPASGAIGPVAEPDPASMSFGAHLTELRARVMISIAAAFVGFVACFSQSDTLMAIVLQPVLDTLTELGLPAKLIATGPTETFLTHLKLSMVAGVFLASPLIFYQGWAFIAAGLYDHERRYVITFLPVSIISFVAGVLFFHFTVLPFGLKFLLDYGGGADGIEPLIRVSEHISFFLLLALIMGGVFQLPLVMLFAIKIGVVTPDQLAEHRRLAILGGFVGGAILTPPDVVTQIALAIPMAVLYEIGIIVGRVGAVTVDEDGQTRINLRGVGLLFVPTLIIAAVVAYTLETRPPVRIRGAGKQQAPETLERKLRELRATEATVWRDMLSARNSLIRLEAMRQLALTSDGQVPTVIVVAMVDEPDPALQVEAASIVARLGSAEQRPSGIARLIALIAQPASPRYAYLAHLELVRLSGRRVAMAVWPDEAARKAAVTEWKKWAASQQ